ncbi:unnamed protein product, partial [marine sediment metagenome]
MHLMTLLMPTCILKNNPYKSGQAILKNMDILIEGIVEEEDIG